MSEPRSPVARSAFRDRSTRLVLFGALSVAIGGICGLFGLLYFFLALTSGRLLGAQTLPVDARSYVMGAMIYFLLGGAFVWVGIGSIRKRRWVRPLMLVKETNRVCHLGENVATREASTARVTRDHLRGRKLPRKESISQFADPALTCFLVFYKDDRVDF